MSASNEKQVKYESWCYCEKHRRRYLASDECPACRKSG